MDSPFDHLTQSPTPSLVLFMWDKNVRVSGENPRCSVLSKSIGRDRISTNEARSVAIPADLQAEGMGVYSVQCTVYWVLGTVYCVLCIRTDCTHLPGTVHGKWYDMIVWDRVSQSENYAMSLSSSQVWPVGIMHKINALNNNGCIHHCSSRDPTLTYHSVSRVSL